MTDAQLSLLDWRPPARVIAFPVSRQRDRVHKCAATLFRKHGHAAELFWRKTVRTILADLERAGVPDDQAREEVRAFFDAVQVELNRIANSAPGGDAA